MTLTVRLNSELGKQFAVAVCREGKTKSEVVTQLLTQLLTQYVAAREPKSAYQVAVEIGLIDNPVVGTPPDLARNHRKYIVAALKAKHKRGCACLSMPGR